MAEQLMRAQLKGSTAAINSTAGYKGVLVLNTDTNHLHVLTGEAGNNIELANKTDIPENVDISGKADISYVDAQLNTKLGKTEKATSAKVADSATKATRDASGNVITTTYATKSEVTSGLAGKQPTGDYATNEALTEGLATKLGATAKAVSAGTADTATKATKDGSGNVISSTYATKSEVTSGLSGKLGKTEKASSANAADTVAWAGVADKPTFATVATTGSYNDLKDKPSVESLPLANQHIVFSVYTGNDDIRLPAGHAKVIYTFPSTGIARIIVRRAGYINNSGLLNVNVLLDNVQLSTTNLSRIEDFMYDIVCYVKKGQQIKFVGNTTDWCWYTATTVEGYLYGG